MQLISCPPAHTRLEHLDEDGFTTVSIYVSDATPLREWDDYKRERAPGISTQRAQARAIGLLIDFRMAVRDRYSQADRRRLFFRGFADALVRGTIADGDDATGLFWMPRARKHCDKIVAYITEFSDWIWTRHGNRPVDASRGEWIAFWQAWRTAQSRSMLGHLRRAERDHGRAGTGRIVRIRGKSAVAALEAVHAFPEANFNDLIEIGFTRKAEAAWSTLRDILIALLMHEGGLRLSEALHLWVGDVFEHPDSPAVAVVRVFHPREGLREYRDPQTGASKQVTSAEYLRLVYGRLPLTDLPGSKAVGWKEPMLSDASEKYMHVFWRSEDAARVFMTVYLRYVQLRPQVRHHPHLFVATGGEPMTVKAYEKVHGVAMRRIGLVPAKARGTTPHGHRHAFGKWLARGGASRKVIKVAMHHKSAFSQDAYTAEDAAETARTISGLSSTIPNSLADLSIRMPILR